MAATPRVIYAWSKTVIHSSVFLACRSKIWHSSVMRCGITFALSVFWTMPFPSWDKLISVVSAALVLSCALAPVTVGALRRNAPELERPFYVKGFTVLGPRFCDCIFYCVLVWLECRFMVIRRTNRLVCTLRHF